jgi:hypothetical protein
MRVSPMSQNSDLVELQTAGEINFFTLSVLGTLPYFIAGVGS